MNKKGFTLVELLAVIVILSIIAIITIPMIANVIEKSKLGAMEDSAYGLIEAANYYYAEHMNEMSSNKLFVIENGIQTSEEKLNYKGKIEGNAKVLLASNGKVALCLTSGKSYAKKEITDTKVVMNTVSSDTTCEINGIDNDSDITIDISGSNSSYYNKNEIDDKLNDIRNDLSDLSNAVSNNTTAIDNLNDSLNIRYEPETDYIQIKVDGEWTDLKMAGFKVKALIPTMTSNSMYGINLSASSVNASIQDCYKACDDDSSSFWADSISASGSTAWFKVAFPEQKQVKKMYIEWGGGTSSSPTVKLQGSNNDSNYTDLTGEINVYETDIEIGEIGSYKYYRVYFNNIGHNSQIGATPGIKTLQLYGN